MDSGNSGSLQSSSGGDEEFDSRADSFSAFLSHPKTQHGPILNQPPPPPPLQTNPSLFDPLVSNYLRLQNQSSLLNPNMVWPKSTLGSEPNSTDIINPMLASPFVSSFTNHSPTVAFSSGVDNNPTSNAPPVAMAARNPKKRSRASRRAPTTVLTTDTTNFRAMVQEFTGIPAPPFTSPSFPRTRLDLFGTPSSMRSIPLDTVRPPYLRRPFPQKLQSQNPFLSSASACSLLSSSALDALGSSNSNTNIISGSSTPSTNYHLPTDQSSNLLNILNPNLTSFLQTTPKFQLANSAMLGSKPQVSLHIPSDDSHIKLVDMEQFGLGHGHVNTVISGLPNLISSDQIALRNDNNAANWNNNTVSTPPNNDDQSLSCNAATGKLIYSASSSKFHGDKGSETAVTRGEGMVESWICSSDWK